MPYEQACWCLRFTRFAGGEQDTSIPVNYQPQQAVWHGRERTIDVHTYERMHTHSFVAASKEESADRSLSTIDNLDLSYIHSTFCVSYRSHPGLVPKHFRLAGILNQYRWSAIRVLQPWSLMCVLYVDFGIVRRAAPFSVSQNQLLGKVIELLKAKWGASEKWGATCVYRIHTPLGRHDLYMAQKYTYVYNIYIYIYIYIYTAIYIREKKIFSLL